LFGQPARRHSHGEKFDVLRLRSCTTRRGSDPSPTEFAEKTVACGKAKIAYFNALWVMSELESISTGKEPRTRELDQFAMDFSVARRKTRNGGGRGDDSFAKAICGQSGRWRRRGRNSSGREWSKRNSNTISMGSISPIGNFGQFVQRTHRQLR
jgi:hypothetical protein